jgi:two-component system, chemotaxis family, protein-glutamate methylesterase/glutaminase
VSARPALASVIGVGASAGGVEALATLMEAMPDDLPAAVLVVLHVAPSGTSVLPDILARHTGMPVATARNGERLEPGHVYVAPPDQHLRVRDGVTALDREPRINGHRPAVDPLLQSLAEAYGPRAIGVILSGSRDDGTLGLSRVKAAGGRCFVQDPGEAPFPAMPANAARAVAVDGVLGIRELAAALGAAARGGDPSPATNGGLGISERRATRLSCPECGGVLFEETENGVDRFACSVGHLYAPESLDVEQARQLESALWAAVRSLEDRADLLGRMADRAIERATHRTAEAHRAEAEASLRRAELIRQIVAEPRGSP